jgi:hypothetical protein
LALGLSAPATAEDGPQIDARLERALWTYDSEGMPLIKSDGDAPTKIWAINCRDLERLTEEGYPQ